MLPFLSSVANGLFLNQEPSVAAGVSRAKTKPHTRTGAAGTPAAGTSLVQELHMDHEFLDQCPP